jgi:hypothetical protein
MLIQQQNSYVPRGKQCTGRREAQNRGISQKSKNPPGSSTVTRPNWRCGEGDIHTLTPGTPLNLIYSTDLPSSFRTKVLGPRGHELCMGASKHR